MALTQREPFAYLAGVVCGDGWCTDLTLGLRVADEDFARTFRLAIRHAFDRDVRCRTDERGYWLVRTSNKAGTFNGLIGYEPASRREWGAWLRGLFDSEGNASLVHRPKVSAHAYGRRVSFYSTEAELLSKAERGLQEFGLRVLKRQTKNSSSHIGSKPVFEIKLASSREAYETFADEIGSSIARKQAVLDAIPNSYQPPGHHARAQAKGVEVRRRRRDAGGRY